MLLRSKKKMNIMNILTL